MIEKIIRTAHGSVFYWLSEQWSNDRDTIFFFPGLTADHTMFENQYRHFANNYNVITWDAPGHGLSRPYEGFSFDDTTDIIMQIMHEVSLKEIICVAQSLGGYYVQALIARHPDKVKAFVGIGTSPYGTAYYSKMDIFWLKQVEWLAMCCPFQWMKKMAAKGAACTEAGYKNMLLMLAPYKKKEYCHLMQMAYNAFLKDNRDLNIECPVLITYGEHDKAGKVQTYCQMWHKETGYPVRTIKNAGHNANVDNPDEMNRVIEHFLNSALNERSVSL